MNLSLLDLGLNASPTQGHRGITGIARQVHLQHFSILISVFLKYVPLHSSTGSMLIPMSL